MKRLLRAVAASAAAASISSMGCVGPLSMMFATAEMAAASVTAANPQRERMSSGTTASGSERISGARPSGNSSGMRPPTAGDKDKRRGGNGRGGGPSARDGPYIPKGALPDQWTSIDDGVEFLPASSLAGQDLSKLPPNLHRHLKKYTNPYSVQPFVNGEDEYDENQQAWRYLGFVVDCDKVFGDDDYYGQNDWGGGTGEGCVRYLIWAAYVDLEYEGGGIGEYQYWDRDTEAWDDTPCKYAEGGVNRCAKMDCHLDDTHFSLLGFFKHISYDDWMEQLFKHEGFCVWSEEEYAFMKNARKAWPQGCDYAGSDAAGNSLYYDLKPLPNGFFTVGLYSDTRCVEDYAGESTVEDIVGNLLINGGSGNSGDYNYDFASMYSTFDEALVAWDTAFEAWRICQPCLAHDLDNVGYGFDDDTMHGESYGKYTDDGYSYNDGANFDCYDDADYTNVNQCMKFMAKTTMQSATFRDLALANSEGTLVEYVTREGYSGKRNTKRISATGTGIFFLISSMLTLYGGFMFYKARKEAKNVPKFLEQPLSGVSGVFT